MKLFKTKGERMIDFLKTQLGHPYVLGGNWPGPSDCSGTVAYVYQRFAGVALPGHYTVKHFEYLGGKVAYPNLLPGKSAVGEIFEDAAKAKRGDIVFVGYAGFYTPTDDPDHEGIFLAPGRILDTRSPTSPLAIRRYDDGAPGSKVVFGRVYSVNGPVEAPKKPAKPPVVVPPVVVPPVVVPPKAPRPSLTFRIKALRRILRHRPHRRRLRARLRRLLRLRARHSGSGS